MLHQFYYNNDISIVFTGSDAVSTIVELDLSDKWGNSGKTLAKMDAWVYNELSSIKNDG